MRHKVAPSSRQQYKHLFMCHPLLYQTQFEHEFPTNQKPNTSTGMETTEVMICCFMIWP